MTLTGTSDATGRWSVAVTEPGDYEVTLDVATVPPGEALRDPSKNPRTVSVGLGASAAALFPLGEPSGGGGGDDDTGDEPSGSPTTDAEGGAAVPTTPGSTGSGVTAARVAQLTVNGLVFGMLLALASVGLSLIYGTTGLSNFAHGEQVSLGGILAYVGDADRRAARSSRRPSSPWRSVRATGWLQDAGLWKPLRRRGVGMIQQMIVTIGLSMAICSTSSSSSSAPGRCASSRDTPTSVSPRARPDHDDHAVVPGDRRPRARRGRATSCSAPAPDAPPARSSDNPALAAASGITVERHDPDRLDARCRPGRARRRAHRPLLRVRRRWYSGGALLLLMFAAVTLGGLGAAFGALAGSIVIGLVVELSSLWIPTDMRYASALVILILVLLVRPQGILGRASAIG